jgi:hypothetical protein
MASKFASVSMLKQSIGTADANPLNRKKATEARANFRMGPSISDSTRCQQYGTEETALQG